MKEKMMTDTRTTDSTLVKTIFFAASRETVWSFLTEKDKLAKWFHPANADLEEGKDYALMGKADDGAPSKLCWGTVLKMDMPSTLVWSFTVRPLNGAMTTVTWTLEEAAGGTKLTLAHEGIEAAAGESALGLIMALDAGWDAHLKDMREAVAV